MHAARGVLLLLLTAAASCGQPERPSAPPAVTTRPAGWWEGSGNRTIGFVSETGRFRVTWDARADGASAPGPFRLTVNSAVSGRPIQVLADTEGESRGSTDVYDDPRPYNLMIESSGLAWTVSVDAIVVESGNTPASSRP